VRTWRRRRHRQAHAGHRQEYSRRSLPWFELHEQHLDAVDAISTLANVKSVKDLVKPVSHRKSANYQASHPPSSPSSKSQSYTSFVDTNGTLLLRAIDLLRAADVK
jgi:hypothetical protein